MGDYAAWADSSRKIGIGALLRSWVENTYLAMIQEAGLSRGTILEIGPGNGEFARTAMAGGFAYTSIERPPALTERLKEAGIDCHFANFPQQSGTLGPYECVYASHVLEHQDTRAEAVAFVEGVKDCLKPGGLIVINCPNVLSHKELFYASDYTHNYVTTPLRVRNLLKDQGFEIVLEERMRFGFRNPLARAIAAVIGVLPHPAIATPLVRMLIANYASDPRIYFRENFTVIGRLPG